MQCCNKEMKQIDKINLLPCGLFVNRVLSVYQCVNPACGCVKYSLSEYNEITGTEVLDRNKPKRIKNIKAWLNALQRQKSYFQDIVPEQGNKSNMAFIFGKNLERKNKLVQIGVDFNGTERNKKEIVLK